MQIPLNTVDFGKTTREWRVLQPVMHRVKLDSTQGKQRQLPFFLQPSPKKSRQSVERRASSSDEESKSKKGPTGPAGLKYRIHYDHQAKNLVLRVIEGRVSPTQVDKEFESLPCRTWAKPTCWEGSQTPLWM